MDEIERLREENDRLRQDIAILQAERERWEELPEVQASKLARLQKEKVEMGQKVARIDAEIAALSAKVGDALERLEA
jgi:predicted  nucleic acid-binding Zn-ribbon protein